MIQGKKADIKASGAAIVFSDEAMSTSDNLVYTITNSAKKVWDYRIEPVVKVDDVIITTGYTVLKLSGQVVFTVDPEGVVTVSGEYVTLTTVTTANEYSYSLENELEDITPFKSDYKKKMVVMSGMTGSLSKFRTIDNYFIDKLMSGEATVIEFYVDEVEDPVRVFALLDTDELSAAASGVQGESVSFISTAKMII